MSKKKERKLEPDSPTKENQATHPEADQTAEEEAVKTPDPAAEAAQWKDKYLRSMAEFENFRKRSVAEKADWIRHATQQLALHICDVVDNFERALLQASAEDIESPFGKGIVLIEKQLVAALEKEGVKKIEALGEPFNPEFHEALAHIPSDYDENIVAAIIQNGYTMHGKVIRPVRVAVANGNKLNTQEE